MAGNKKTASKQEADSKYVLFIHPLIVRNIAQVGTFRFRGCRGFIGPMYLCQL